ncbi:MAG TPA: polysaccharide biosynthesis tyrosine autokinase [Bacteroidales bacterium]|jgi:capsular exopolysaccharide synthesis family protein|nr:polysaccharide biosynthesis tyrosine autokinase [Bacteroidales bacterium]
MNTDISQKMNPPQKDFDIRHIFFLMFGHWYWFIVSLTLALVGGYLYLRYTKPVYRTTATILIEEGDNNVSNGTAQILEGIGLQPGNKNLDNQLIILGSYTLVENALKELPFGIDYHFKGRIRSSNCYPNNPIVVLPDSIVHYVNNEYIITLKEGDNFHLSTEGKDIDTIISFGQKISFDGNSFTIIPDQESWNLLENGPVSFRFFSIDNLTENYRNRLKIKTASKEGTIVQLTLEGPDKEKDRDFLNKLTEKFFESNLNRKNQEASRIIEFIDLQLIGISDSLMITENRLEEFRSKHRVMDISIQGNKVIEQAVKLEDDKAKLMLESNYFDYLNRYLSDSNTQETPIAPSTMGISDPLLSQLVGELAQLHSDFYSGGLGIKNPFQNQIRQKINTTRKSLQESLKNIIQANNMAKMENMEQIRTLNVQASGLPVTERKLLGIEREFKLNDVMYTFLLQKRAEAQIQKASNTPDNELVDKARTERNPVSPKKDRIYIIALLMGLGTPIGVLLLIDLFNNKIKTEEELKHLTNLPIAGHIPHNHSETQIVVLKEPDSIISEAFRNLRTRIQFFTKDVRSPVILVTSAMPGEGKTFTAINLASVYSLKGKKTVLVGFDLRKPKIYRDFNLHNDKGVSTYLIRKDSLKDIIQTTEFPNLFLITGGPIPPNPAELASSEEIKDLILNLKKQFDYIIIDSAPIGTVADSYAITDLADAIIMIVRHGKTIRTILENTLNDVKSNDVHGLSLLVNDMDIRSLSYKYAYSYGYRYRYKDSIK